jgi:recombination protein U
MRVKMNNYSNRGKYLEDILKLTHDHYHRAGIAEIQKIHVKRVQNINGKLIYPKKSTVDFVGCWKGKFIAFDAKQTSRNSIHVSNFKPDQISYLENINKLGGIGFFLIYLKTSSRCWALFADNFNVIEGHKSLNEEILCQCACEVRDITSSNPPFDYLGMFEKLDILFDMFGG